MIVLGFDVIFSFAEAQHRYKRAFDILHQKSHVYDTEGMIGMARTCWNTQSE